MKTYPKNITAMTVSLLALVLVSMNFGNAYAHTLEVVDDYAIEIGWNEEPPIQGIENSIELVVTHATEADRKLVEEMDSMDMAHDEDMAHEHEGGISELEDTIQVIVTLDGISKTISLSETAVDGIYQAKFTPSSSGFPVVHLSGTILDTEIDLDMHPEEIESLNILSPLQQMSHGISPSDVQCKEGLELFMRVNEDSVICASNDLGQRLMELGVVDYF